MCDIPMKFNVEVSYKSCPSKSKFLALLPSLSNLVVTKQKLVSSYLNNTEVHFKSKIPHLDDIAKHSV